MKMNVLKPILLGALVAGTLSAEAHRAWILPQETQLSGEDRWVGFEAAVSNDIFVANYHAVRFNDLIVLQPDGDKSEAENLHTGKYRTVFDVKLEDEAKSC